MFAVRNLHEYRKQQLKLNEIDELSDLSKDDKQLEEYSKRIDEPTLEDYEK